MPLDSTTFQRCGCAVVAGLFVAQAAVACRQPANKDATLAQPSQKAGAAPIASQAGPPASSPVPADVSGIVDVYRKIIVLVEDEGTLEPDDRPRAAIVGQVLYQENHQRLTTLTEQLVAELVGFGASNTDERLSRCSGKAPRAA
jgi:hypothetical protein